MELGHLAIEHMSTQQLLSTYAAILRELRRRGTIRTLNAPAGDLAEAVVAKAYGGVLAPNSEKSWDVRAADERLLQVKCRVIESSATSKPVQFSVFRSWDFGAAVFVVLSADTYDVLGAYEVPAGSVRDATSTVNWVGGRRLTLSMARLAALPGAIDVTERIQSALLALDDAGIASIEYAASVDVPNS
jgi:hypothetical protein